MTRLIDADAMADLLTIHPKTLLAAARDGIVPRVVIGMKCVRFNPEKVIAALEQHGEARVIRRHNRPDRVAARAKTKPPATAAAGGTSKPHKATRVNSQTISPPPAA